MKKPRWNRQKKCQWCGQAFTAERKEQMFCCVRCGHQHNMKGNRHRNYVKEKKRCAYQFCHQWFTPKRKEQKFCSLSCSVSDSNSKREYRRTKGDKYVRR